MLLYNLFYRFGKGYEKGELSAFSGEPCLMGGLVIAYGRESDLCVVPSFDPSNRGDRLWNRYKEHLDRLLEK